MLKKKKNEEEEENENDRLGLSWQCDLEPEKGWKQQNGFFFSARHLNYLDTR